MDSLDSVVLHYVMLAPDLQRRAIYVVRQGDLDFDSPELAKAFVEQNGVTSAMIIGRRAPSEFFDGKGWAEIR